MSADPDRVVRRTPRTSPAKGAPIPRGKHKTNSRLPAWLISAWWFEWAILIAVAILVAVVVRIFLLQTFYIPSESMENTLLVGDHVLVDKVSYRFHDPKRGQIIVFNPPAVWKERSANNDDFIKRIVGIGGDHVICCDTKGRITINGYALNEDYLYPGNAPSNSPFDVTVPSGRYFVMGDHRAKSGDSRFYRDFQLGTISRSSIVGRAFAMYLPLDRIGTLGVPDTFKRVPDPHGG